jgi:enoyl-CoA hydratase/carnithine racemase
MHEFGDWLSDLSDEIASIYASKVGSPAAVWRAAMLAETWYSAQEAVDAGLADRIAGVETEDDTEDTAPPPADRFDLAAVGAKYADRCEAPPPADLDVLAATLDRLRHAGNRHGLKRPA